MFSTHEDKNVRLIENVKKGGLLLISGIDITVSGQVWTCLGVVGIAINMNLGYLHLSHYSTTSILWYCGDDQTIVASACEY